MIYTLTGFMGCGKTSVGRALAERLGWEFIDLDEYIEHKLGRSISTVFATEGEEKFRAVEAEAVRDVIIMHQLTGTDLVLALGGGTLTIAPVQPLILEQTSCVYLRATADSLREWVKGSTDRPLLASADFDALLQSRIPIYEKAGTIIDVDSLSYDDVVNTLLG